MSISFNVDEIFEIAEQIERNGAAYYRKASMVCTSPQAQKLFIDLALMEEEHEQVFTELRKHLKNKPAEDSYYDPFGEGILYLRAFAEGKVFPLKTDVELEIQEKKSLQAIVKCAIEREKDSIVFYLGIKELVPDLLGKDKIDDIIKEEMKHIRMLTGGEIK